MKDGTLKKKIWLWIDGSATNLFPLKMSAWLWHDGNGCPSWWRSNKYKKVGFPFSILIF